jgi:hypothetical protein
VDNIIVLLLVLIFLLYLIFRQFTEQRVTWRTLLLLPILSVYASYVELVPAFAHFASVLLIIGLALGVLAGLATGIFRGRNTRVRLDGASGLIYARPALPSSLTWLGLLIIRFAVVAVSYSPLSHASWAGVLIAFASALFLLNVITQKFMVYLQSNRLQSNPPQQQSQDAA